MEVDCNIFYGMYGKNKLYSSTCMKIQKNIYNRLHCPCDENGGQCREGRTGEIQKQTDEKGLI